MIGKNMKRVSLTVPDWIDEIVEKGWFTVKKEHLINTEPHFEEARVILTEAENAPGLSEFYIQE